VHAITRGHVASAGWIPGYGKTVRVRADGKVFYYPHLSRIRVRHGHVRTGQVLGRVGSTGYSTGPHLHVEIRVHGRSVNPRHILVRHGVHLGVRH
jgi:murein DD-endopeptidase MepM/ murein hydrolase activator NlpD